MRETTAFAGDAAIAARLDFARYLARSVGREANLFRNTAEPAALGVSAKGLQDFVTIADRRAEETIKAELSRAFPEDGFLGEETGGEPTQAGFWVVDPIDGTANYIRGLRHWGVSIAYVLDGQVRVGCIFDAASGNVYSASLGGGAFCESRPVRVSDRSDPTEALAIVGYSRRTSFDVYQSMLRDLYDIGIEYRRLGSAAIGLVRVADGIADLYVEAHLNSWDVLAGVLIAGEAGARVTMPPLSRMLAAGGAVAACAPGMAPHLGGLLRGLTHDGSVTAQSA